MNALILIIVNGTAKQDASRSELRAANIFIAARYLNINGLVEAGHAIQEITLGTDIAAKITIFKKQVLSRNYLDYFLVQKSDMKFYYDPVNNRILLDTVDVRGGYIELFGQIISTSTGKISALDGFGSIKVVNNTDFSLAVMSLSTGSGGHGAIKITDTSKYTGTIGLPLPSTEIAILDDDGKQLPAGSVGEIAIRGPQVMAG